MTRRHVSFALDGAQLIGTLDDAPGAAGLLLVSGGNEVRAGAFAGQARLAAEIAAAGFPVLRFDRRGIGDSTGENGGFRSSGPDIAAALAAFRVACPRVTRVAAFGNCDAASALMLAQGAGCDALILANPWTFDSDGNDTPAPAMLRRRYAAKLANPREWARLLSGKVRLGTLAHGLAHAVQSAPPATSLAGEIKSGLAAFCGETRILLAEADRTGQAFAATWDAGDTRLARCPGASHAFVELAAQEWLLAQILDVLTNEQARQLDVG